MPINDPMVVKVIFIRKVSPHRYNFIAEVLRLNVGSVIKLGGTGYCVGMTRGTEVFDIDQFTDKEWKIIFSGEER